MSVIQVLNIKNLSKRNIELDKLCISDDFEYYKKLILETKKSSKENQIALLQYLENKKPTLFPLKRLLVHKYLKLNELGLSKKLLDNLSKTPNSKGKLDLLYALYYKKNGERDKAIFHFGLALKYSKNLKQSFQPLLHLFQENLNILKFNQAKIYLDKLNEGWPQNSLVLVKNIKYLKATNKDEKLFNHLKSYIQLDPTNIFLRTEFLHQLVKAQKNKEAINFLAETKKIGVDHISIRIIEGTLYRRNDDFETAIQVFKTAANEYPNQPGAYLHYLDLAFFLGEIQVAFDMIQTLKEKFPFEDSIFKKEIELHFRIGRIAEARILIKEYIKKFPLELETYLKLKLKLELKEGNFFEARRIINKIPSITDSQIQEKLISLASLEYLQYNYKKTITLLKEATLQKNLSPKIWWKLASAHLSLADISSCIKTLESASLQLLNKTNNKGNRIIPFKSHISLIANDIRLNPKAFNKITKANNFEKWSTYKEILLTDSNYFGAAFYLCIYLRSSGIFDQLESKNYPVAPYTIPKTIIQYWDQPSIPKQIKHATNTWIEKNRDFEYVLFNKKSAYEFIKLHYTDRELNAFLNCNHPAMESDYFRLAYLNAKGGFYADVDDACRKSLSSFLDKKFEFILIQEDLGTIGNNFLAFAANHPIVRNAFEQATRNLGTYFNESPWFKTGPGLITQTFANAIIKEPEDLVNSKMSFKVLSQKEICEYIYQHLPLPYKASNKGWFTKEYRNKLK